MPGRQAAEGSASRDLLGFNLPVLTARQEQDRQESVRQTEAFEREWDTYARKQKLPSRGKLKDLIRKGGIPHKHRTWVWGELSGARQMQESNPPTYFHNLVAAGETQSKSLHQIELDLPRTYPEHAWLHGAEGQAALRATLVAYSMHNAKAGYCQGLNFVASTLLLATNRDPETAFWLLVALLEGILYKNMYGPYLPGFQVEMKALAKLVQKKLPQLHSHLDQMGCEMTILATDWFLCLFVTTLPHEISARVLDCLFCEGSKILFRVSLALLQLHQKLLLSHDNAGELIQPLKESVNSWWSADVLLRTAFDNIGGLPQKKIDDYRDRHKEAIMANVREREVARRKQEALENARERQRKTEEERQRQIDADRTPAEKVAQAMGNGMQVLSQTASRTRAALTPEY